jgi:hypothetical protein
VLVLLCCAQNKVITSDCVLVRRKLICAVFRLTETTFLEVIYVTDDGRIKSL